MKKTLQDLFNPMTLVAVLIVGIGVSSPVFFSGCKSPPEVVAYKAVGTQVITVEAAKKAVADAYVAGQISEKDFQAIRTISNQYDAAVNVERDAVLAYKAGTDTNGLNRAMVAVSASSADLMTLIFKLLPPAQAAKLKGL